jgi:hypothetical protein
MDALYIKLACSSDFLVALKSIQGTQCASGSVSIVTVAIALS